MSKKIYFFASLILLVSLMSFIQAVVHDSDKDGIGSDVDNCPLDYNPLQENSDDDEYGDICDASPGVNVTNSTQENNETEEDKKRTSSGSSGNHFVQFCDPNWECSGWSECYDGFQKRVCKDTNYCSVSYNKPIEGIACEISEKSLIEEKGINIKNLLFGILTSLGVFLILLIFILILKNQ